MVIMMTIMTIIALTRMIKMTMTRIIKTRHRKTITTLQLTGTDMKKGLTARTYYIMMENTRPMVIGIGVPFSLGQWNMEIRCEHHRKFSLDSVPHIPFVPG